MEDFCSKYQLPMEEALPFDANNYDKKPNDGDIVELRDRLERLLRDVCAGCSS